MLHIYAVQGDNCLTKTEVAELQSLACKTNNGCTPKGSSAAKAQSLVDRTLNKIVKTSDPVITRYFCEDGTRVISKRLAKRLTSAVAKTNHGIVQKGSFSAIVQSAADLNEQSEKSGEIFRNMLEISRPRQINQGLVKALQRRDAIQNDGRILRGSDAALAQSALDKTDQIKLKLPQGKLSKSFSSSGSI
jgi:hypothetical protein